MIDIVKKFLEDFTAGRWDECKSALTEDATYEEIATGTRVQGADDFVNTIEKWKRAFPDLTSSVQCELESGDLTMLEVEFAGTQSAPIEASFGSFPATNRRAVTRVVFVARLENDKIAEERCYFDLLGLMNQLGLMPGLGQMPRPEAAAGVPATPPH